MNFKIMKYSSILTILLILVYLFTSVTLPFVFVESVEASSIEKNDVYKGVGIAVLLILFSKLGQSQEDEYSDYYNPPPDNFGDGKTDEPIMNLSKDEKNLLARLIYAESRGEPYQGQVAVGAVVLNRVRSSDFPNTVRQVIYQGGQFTPVTNGHIHLNPNQTAYDAVEDAIYGLDPSQGALFFYNPEKAKTLWWLETRQKTVKIGEHVFAR